MNKRLSLFFFASLVSFLAHAQWMERDTLTLRRTGSADGEIKLNPNLVKEIDFGTFVGEPIPVIRKSALDLDVTLPKVFPEKKKIVLTLRPYSVHTKYNYDPIYQKKIDVKKDTWKYGDGFRIPMNLYYSNWAKTPLDPGIRKSLDEIEATGIRYNPLANRVNNVAVGGYQTPSGNGLSGDFMAPFTKDFWDVKGKKRRARTLEVLRNYGDSTTVMVNDEIVRTTAQ